MFALLDGDVMNKAAIFLDQKPQQLEIAGKAHILQFVEGFKTLTINGHPFRADFGGFPMVISVQVVLDHDDSPDHVDLQGKKHYLRLTALPRGVTLVEEARARPAPRGRLSPPARARASVSPGQEVSRPLASPPPRSPPSPPKQEDTSSQVRHLESPEPSKIH